MRIANSVLEELLKGDERCPNRMGRRARYLGLQANQSQEFVWCCGVVVGMTTLINNIEIV